MPPTLTANSSQLTGLLGQFNQKVDSCYVRLTAESQEKPRLHANLGHGHITAAQSAVGRSEAFDIWIPSLGPAQLQTLQTLQTGETGACLDLLVTAALQVELSTRHFTMLRESPY